MLASVRQEDLPKLCLGQSAPVTLAPDAPEHYAGRVTNLGQRFDPESRLMEVRIELSNSGNRLRPEMLAVAELAVAGMNTAITIPSDAVQQINGQDAVFVQTAPGRFTVRAVRVGTTEGGRTPVAEGLQSGDVVVTQGSFALRSQLLKASLQND
jgi:cobalt-zinc-cadmium efflux system membrane fusion protein